MLRLVTQWRLPEPWPALCRSPCREYKDEASTLPILKVLKGPWNMIPGTGPLSGDDC